MTYLKHFTNNVKPRKDGHNSHTKNIELIDLVRDNEFYFIKSCDIILNSPNVRSYIRW